MPPSPAVDPILDRWAASGAMALTGTEAAPLGPPERLVPGVEELGAGFPGLDALALLGERAALAGLRRHGATSCGGSGRLLPTADGWLAVSLPRVEDVEAVPAWLEIDGHPPGEAASAVWDRVRAVVRDRPTAALVDRAGLLQLAVAALDDAPRRDPVVRVPLGDAPARPEPRGLLVVDLTGLWAGPLCGDLLARSGATVVKVESTGRPDGARRGPRAFFDLLNGAKRSVAVDFGCRAGLAALRGLLQRADVVLEASRPRALEQLGVRAAELVAAGGPQVWVSITGYGRAGPDATRVAFGDDAAVAGGLVARRGGSPFFCADAVADPLSGLVAAKACLDALAGGGRWLVDVAMAAVAAELAGPVLGVPAGLAPAAPRARPVGARAAALGADTADVLRDLGIDR
jgi:hypothetical protein